MRIFFVQRGCFNQQLLVVVVFVFFSPKARLVEGTPHLFGFHTVLPFTRAFSAASPGEMTLVEQIGLCLGRGLPGKKQSVLKPIEKK